MRETKSTNPELIKLIRFLKKKSNEYDVKIWRDVAQSLSKPRRSSISVNLSRINRHTSESDTIIVPGKILGSGNLNHSLTVASFSVSEKAKTKLSDAKAKYLSIPDLVKQYPKGSKIKIIG